MVNPADATSLRRIINTPPRGIGKTTLSRLEAAAERTGRRLYDVVMDPATHKSLGRIGQRVSRFAELMSTLQAFVDRPAAKALTEVFSRSGLQASLAGEETIDEVPLENVQNLINEAGKYDLSEPEGSLIGWLEQTSLASDVDTIDEAAGKVTLMTLHASKGLEFPVVYMVGLEEGLLPFRRDEESQVDEEEERRLCFVGITRAKRELTLTRARYRVRRGQATRSVRSPFLRNLPAGEIEWIEHKGDDPRKWRPDGQLPDDVEQWGVGTLVRHPDYGLGRLIAIRRSSSGTQVGVAFQGGGQETFVLEFAELTRVPFDEVD
jgi:DNA helicase-2/ATP-dependent DNA helicase PcrA